MELAHKAHVDYLFEIWFNFKYDFSYIIYMFKNLLSKITDQIL